ncbi:AAA family ATPase [Shimia aestuarii]|uniref:AAA domain-containing protein n=1 Tax=Shimia aestuarii TaxID=254406 RepID=A0A1I4HSY6_9RHOB|nr:AAA family ATPase [Shimia aestuarii]SFL44897.1 AAA domain-containing protein [Shimia aestuarii]
MPDNGSIPPSTNDTLEEMEKTLAAMGVFMADGDEYTEEELAPYMEQANEIINLPPPAPHTEPEPTAPPPDNLVNFTDDAEFTRYLLDMVPPDKINDPQFQQQWASHIQATLTGQRQRKKDAERAKPDLRARTLGEVLDEKITTEFVVENIYIAGYVTCYTGPKGSFKTTVAAFELLTFASKRHLSPKYPTLNFNAGCIFAGENYSDVKACFYATIHYHNFPNEVRDKIHVLDRSLILNAEAAEAFVAANPFANYDLIIIDTMQAYSSYEDRNRDDIMKPFVDAAFVLARYYKAHVKILCHPTKSSEDHNEKYMVPKGAGVVVDATDGQATQKRSSKTALQVEAYPNPKYRGARYDPLVYDMVIVNDCPELAYQSIDENGNEITKYAEAPVVNSVRLKSDAPKDAQTQEAPDWYTTLGKNQARIVDVVFGYLHTQKRAPDYDELVDHMLEDWPGRSEAKHKKSDIKKTLTGLQNKGILERDGSTLTLSFERRKEVHHYLTRVTESDALPTSGADE